MLYDVLISEDNILKQEDNAKIELYDVTTHELVSILEVFRAHGFDVVVRPILENGETWKEKLK